MCRPKQQNGKRETEKNERDAITARWRKRRNGGNGKTAEPDRTTILSRRHVAVVGVSFHDIAQIGDIITLMMIFCI